MFCLKFAFKNKKAMPNSTDSYKKPKYFVSCVFLAKTNKSFLSNKLTS